VLDAQAKPGERGERVHHGKISEKMIAERFLVLDT
jgi:hypothetical protein